MQGVAGTEERRVPAAQEQEADARVGGHVAMQNAVLKVPAGSWTSAYDGDGQVRDECPGT
jgi:hypothetical protein